MSEPKHAHTWEPIWGEPAQYGCSECPSTGYRARGGQIVEHKRKKSFVSPWTARNQTNGTGGRIEPRIAEDWDGGKERDS